jgi:L-alanine-DL-glutamate epimerase-like enolase superfamily enzyme
MRKFLDVGYSVVKMKIGGTDLADDLKRIEAVLEVLDGDGSRLAVDVNGRFDLQTALDYGRAIEPYGLFWYEEVGDPSTSTVTRWSASGGIRTTRSPRATPARRDVHCPGCTTIPTAPKGRGC